jgi:hypothetical protein
MKRLLAMAAMVAWASAAWGQNKPIVSSDPLTAEQQAIYRSFFESYSNGARTTVNLADTTLRFDPQDMDRQGCLKKLNLGPDPEKVHKLTAAALPEHRYVLVDPEAGRAGVRENDPDKSIRQGKKIGDAVEQGFAAGLLSVSEIAFSQDHHYAVFQYDFSCGSLCGHGALVIYENEGGSWKPLEETGCSRWVS